MLVTSKERVAGAGVMHHLAQDSWKLRDMVDLMLSCSDNTAANVLLDHFGSRNVSDWLQASYPGVKLQRYFIHPVVDGKDNLITAEALLPVWQSFFVQNDEFDRLVKTALHEQTERGKLVYYAGDVGFTGNTYNKTGDLTDVEHDCARLQLGKDWFDCLILTKFAGTTQHQSALQMQREVGRVLLNNLQTGSGG